MILNRYFYGFKFTGFLFNKLEMQKAFPSRILDLSGCIYAVESEKKFTKLRVGDYVIRKYSEDFVTVLSKYNFEKYLSSIFK